MKNAGHPDTTLTQRIRDALQATGYFSLQGVHVHVDAGHASLHGSVPSWFLKQVAQEVALGVCGRGSVGNRLVVRSGEQNGAAATESCGEQRLRPRPAQQRINFAELDQEDIATLSDRILDRMDRDELIRVIMSCHYFPASSRHAEHVPLYDTSTLRQLAYQSRRCCRHRCGMGLHAAETRSDATREANQN